MTADDDDLEVADLEPIALDPASVAPQESRSRPPAVWITFAVVVAGLWVGIAIATRGHSHRSALPGASSASSPETVAPPPLPNSFVEQFANIGTGRFAVVVGGRLYVLDGRARSSTPVDLGTDAEPVTIEDQSGRELLVKTQRDNLLLDTTGLETTSIPIDRSAVSSHDGLWWFVGSDRLLTRADAENAVRITPGVDVLAVLGGRFVIAANHGFALWNRGSGTTQPIAPDANRLLDSNGAAALFAATCASACDELVAVNGTTHTFPAPNLVQAASLSPDASRVAIGNLVYDTANGHELARVTFPLSNTPHPYAWTDDGTLLLAQDGAVAVLRPNDRDTRQIIGLNGLSQIAALP